MFDVFYSGSPPGLFVHEQPAHDLDHARQLCRTRFFWWTDSRCDYAQFDFDFVPPPWQSSYTHVWPSNFHQFSGTFLVPKFGPIEYHFHSQEIPLKDRPSEFVTCVEPCVFNTAWAPHPLDPPYIYVFGNQWHSAEKMPTVEYHAPGATQRKYMAVPRARLLERHDNKWNTLIDCEWDYSWRPDPGDPPLIYVFGNQWHSAVKMPTVEYHVPGATQRKYMNWPRAQLLPDQTHWSKPDNIGWDDVDTTWVPDPGSPPYIYQFGTQWQKTGGAVYTVPGATQVKYVEQIKTTTRQSAHQVYVIDHMNGQVQTVIDQLKDRVTVVKTVRFFDNYLDTLRRIANASQDEVVWVVSSICDYQNFDFTWHPELWQSHMLHVFASDDQKFGDTFFMHVPTFQERINSVEILDWYELNFCEDQTVPRRPWPTVEYSGPSMMPVLQDHSFATTYTLFRHESHGSMQAEHTASVWSKKHRELVSFSAGNSTALVPKDIKQHLETQVYDYPYIKPAVTQWPETLQDIVFVSYDELNADQNYQDLKQRFPRAQRVHGVEGMVNALIQAAKQSTTDWYYAVFAKTQVHEDFNFDFAPDRFQQPKHYIFHAVNVVNDLVYGEMGIILYNRQMVLAGPKRLGIDYTMSFPNETIPIVSAWGRFNTSAYQTWRTAFRETAKLKLFDSQRPTVENSHRLHVWQTRAHGDHAEWALRGACDGVEFFNQCGGNEEQMKHMFSWKWLRERFETAYGNNL